MKFKLKKKHKKYVAIGIVITLILLLAFVGVSKKGYYLVYDPGQVYHCNSYVCYFDISVSDRVSGNFAITLRDSYGFYLSSSTEYCSDIGGIYTSQGCDVSNYISSNLDKIVITENLRGIIIQSISPSTIGLGTLSGDVSGFVLRFNVPLPNPNDDGGDNPPPLEGNPWIFIVIILAIVGGLTYFYIKSRKKRR